MTIVEEVSNVQTKIIECIDAGLKHLGQSVGQAIYFHMEKNFGVKKEEILNHPEAFSEALRSIFGQGANVIEGLIVYEVQEKFELNLDSQTSIVKAIETAKTKNRKFKVE